MPLPYNPKDAKECLPAGTYEGTLTQVKDTTSKTSGNDMQDLIWRVYEPGSDKSFLIHDYIVVPSQLHKLKQLARALDRLGEFEAGTFQADDHVECNVAIRLGVEQSDNGFPDKNKVNGYLPLSHVRGSTPTPRSAPPPARPPARKPSMHDVPYPDDDKGERPEFHKSSAADRDIPF